MIVSNYSKNVFINCPYDDRYKGLLDVILFVIVVFGFNPRVALESSDSGVNRIDKIVQLIKESKYGIHDLSRIISNTSGEYYRLNMPLELGIDYGCSRFLEPERSDKKFLILENEKFSLLKALSDLSGIDTKAHENNGAKLVECLRGWFAETVGLRDIPGPEKIFDDYTEDFQVYLLDKAKKLGFKETNYIQKISIPEYIDYVKEWRGTQSLYSNILSLVSDDKLHMPEEENALKDIG